MTDIATQETAPEQAFQLGDPVEHRGVVVCPLFPRTDPRARYLTLEEAIGRGLRIEEVGAGGSVPELRVVNPLVDDVLLYDGEELIGAKQNRILNVSVLVGGGKSLPIPVSCVEEGRWRHVSSSFAAAPHASHPQLRRRKAESLRLDPLARGISQGEVWDAVRETNMRMDADAPTGASAAAYRRWREPLEELEPAFPLQPGQTGALLALGDDLCLDYVSRPDAFERLYPKLLRGYMLDALAAARPAGGEREADRGVRGRGRLGSAHAPAVGGAGRGSPARGERA